MSLFAELTRCRPWIEAALEHSGGTHTFDDIVSAVYAGQMQFWPAENACAVTEIVNFPRRKVLHIFLAGGNMQEIVDMDGPAADFAKANGCTAMTIAGRRGWKKILEHKGYSERFTTLSKELL
jgi:hypothetical protein